MTDFFSKITSSALDETNIDKSRSNIDNAVNRIGQESGRMMIGDNKNQYHSGYNREEQNSNQATSAENDNNDVATNAETKKKEAKEKLPQKRILGLKPLHFGLGLFIVVGGAFLAYQQFKTGGTKSIIK